MAEYYCKLGCELFLNFTQECPEVTDALDPDPYILVTSGDCVEQCLLLKFNSGEWWRHTDFASYFSCIEAHKEGCDYWQIYKHCSPFYETASYACQLLSFCCCIVIALRLYKEIHRGLLQQSLFLSTIHNLLHGCISEESFEVWAMYVLPKGVPNAVAGIVLKYMHNFLILTSLLWSIVSALILLRVTQAKLCLVWTRYKVALMVMVECCMATLMVLTIVGRLLTWGALVRSLKYIFLVMLALVLGMYSVLTCKAKHLQRLAAKHQVGRQPTRAQSQDASVTQPRSRRRPRIQIKPLLLLLTILIFTYGPFLVVFFIPGVPLTRTSRLITWFPVQLVGVWNFLAMLVIDRSRKRVKKGVDATIVHRAWWKKDRLVGPKNATVAGSFSFTRIPPEDFFRIRSQPMPFGFSSSMKEDEDANQMIVGDFEQSSDGELLQWTKRPSGNVQNTVEKVGLPLEKFRLFIDGRTATNFPPDTKLIPLHHGFCLALCTPENEETRRSLIQALNEFEVAALEWNAMQDGHGAPLNDLERAQLNWAYDEATLKLKSCIEIVLRWKRVLADSAFASRNDFELTSFPSSPNEQFVGPAFGTSSPPLATTSSDERSTPSRNRQGTIESVAAFGLTDHFSDIHPGRLSHTSVS